MNINHLNSLSKSRLSASKHR